MAVEFQIRSGRIERLRACCKYSIATVIAGAGITICRVDASRLPGRRPMNMQHFSSHEHNMHNPYRISNVLESTCQSGVSNLKAAYFPPPIVSRPGVHSTAINSSTKLCAYNCPPLPGSWACLLLLLIDSIHHAEHPPVSKGRRHT